MHSPAAPPAMPGLMPGPYPFLLLPAMPPARR